MAASPPSPPEPREPGRDLRAIALSLAAVGLTIGVLASLGPAQRAALASSARGRPAAATTTTTSPKAPSRSAPSSSIPPSAGKVAVLAPVGSPQTSGVESKLTADRYSLVSHAPIPASWVANMTVPIVRYPNGLYTQAVGVAKALGLGPSAVSSEPTGTSVGSDVIEVYVPAT